MTVTSRRVGVVSPHEQQLDDRHGNQDKRHEDEVEDNKEDAKVKMIKDPGCPSKEEVDRHYLTHMPFRSWCPICVQGKGRENPHYRKEEKEAGETIKAIP